MSTHHSSSSDTSGLFKNGSDIHFDYNNAKNGAQPPNSKSVSAKKKKRSKNPDIQATINNPDEDYPTSRVIKQGPNGDVIVERLDNDEDSNGHEENDHSHNHNDNHGHHHNHNDNHDHHHNHDHNQAHNNIWDSASIEEQENLKAFWESLTQEKKMELVKIDKKSIMEIFKQENRANHLKNISNNQKIDNSNNSNGNSNSNLNSNNQCSCKYCGRRSNIIEDELDNIYDNHFDDIIDFIHEVRDINDLNALPGLLFGGFHMLEEEHKLQKRQQKLKQNNDQNDQNLDENLDENLDLQQHQNQSQNHKNDSHFHENRSNLVEKLPPKLPILSGEENFEKSSNEKPIKSTTVIDKKSIEKQPSITREESIENQPSITREESISKLDSKKRFNGKLLNSKSSTTLFDVNMLNNLLESFDEIPSVGSSKSNTFNTDKELEEYNLAQGQIIREKLLDPKFSEALGNFDFKLGSSLNNSDVNYANLVQKAGSLREIIMDLQNSNKLKVEQEGFLKNMGQIFGSIQNFDQNNKNQGNLNSNKFNEQFSQGLSSFAEDLLKNDGYSFIEMMETLSESRTIREDLLSEKLNLPPHQLLDNVQQTSNNGNNKPLPKVTPPILQKDLGSGEEHIDEQDEDNEGEEEEEGEEEAEEYSAEEGDDFLPEEENSDTESEISEEEKMQEIRRLFLIQVIKIFQERLKNAYKERISQDRTQQLIDELEAEENAKKERELKKLKQKEKAKEKKRLLQLAKEEEKRKKDEEVQRVEEEKQEKQALLKAEQRRRKEETKLKREEEKRKKLEEMKRKEEEHKKKVEAQQKREEEFKRIKEERRKKTEEEKRKKDEEKIQKELERKKREEELKQRTQNQQLSSNFEASQIDRSSESYNLQHQGIAKPSSNHLLEQLYHAKPKSNSPIPISNPYPSISPPIPGPITLSPTPNSGQYLSEPSISSTPQPTFMDSTLLNNPILNNLSPNSLLSSINTTSTLTSPWSQNSIPNHQLDNTILHNSLSNGLFQPLGNDSTSQFNSGLGLNNIWSNTNSRNNSIWSNVPNIGGNSMGSNTPTFANSSLWGTTRNSLSSTVLPTQNQQPQQQLPQQQQQPQQQYPQSLQPRNGDIGIDRELLEAACNRAYQSLKDTNQLEYGVAPIQKLFQTTKLILGSQISLNQFLSQLKPSNQYHVEFIWNDSGAVTHIKMEPTSLSQQFQPEVNRRPSQPPGLNNFMESSLMHGAGVSNTRSFWS